MTDYNVTPASGAQWATTSHFNERRSATAEPFRMHWGDFKDTSLGNRFRLALKKLEGLLYVVGGSIPMYAEGKQWWHRDNPRCLWGVEQQYEIQLAVGGDRLVRYDETAALGNVGGGSSAGCSVPIRSRSGDPNAQFARAAHSAYFPLGSVERLGNVTVHDPAAMPAANRWPDADDVVIRWTLPAAVTSVDAAPVVHASIGDFVTAESSPGVWETTIPAQAHDTWVDWYIAARVNGGPGEVTDPQMPDGQVPRFDGRTEDPEHRAAGAAYSYCQYTHYNPYAHGLPELIEKCRKGTDWYRFTPDEQVQPALINLVRFVLDQLVTEYSFEHAPSLRTDEECCLHMPIRWRWSGSAQPDHYVGGGKEPDGEPLHNRSALAGSEAARRSWRGVGMRWRNDYPPGFFAGNWYFGDDESWLAWPGYLRLDPDPQDPINLALMRDYMKRGLCAGDCIDPVHIEELIAAIEYLCDHGLWKTERINTRPFTPGTMWGSTCGHWYSYEHFEFKYDPPETYEEEHYSAGCDLCCQDCYSNPWVPENGWCIPWPGPCTLDPGNPDCFTWEQCNGLAKCYAEKWNNKHYYDNPVGYTVGVENYREDIAWGLDCGGDGFFQPGAYVGNWFNSSMTDEGCFRASTVQRSVYGSSYYLCGPARHTANGPDDDHGNGITKHRRDDAGNIKAYPSMGNRYDDMHACEEPDPTSPDPPWFERVVPVKNKGPAPQWINTSPDRIWNATELEPYLTVAGIGIWKPDGSEPLTKWYDRDANDLKPYPIIGETCSEDCDDPEVLCNTHRQAHIDIDMYGYEYVDPQTGSTEWRYGCKGEHVYVSIDLNKDAEGVPQLRDYDLGIADPPFAGGVNDPCLTHFAMNDC